MKTVYILAGLVMTILLLGGLYFNATRDLAVAKSVNKDWASKHAKVLKEREKALQAVITAKNKYQSLDKSTRRLQREFDKKINADWRNSPSPQSVDEFVLDLQESAIRLSTAQSGSDSNNPDP